MGAGHVCEEEQGPNPYTGVTRKVGNLRNSGLREALSESPLVARLHSGSEASACIPLGPGHSLPPRMTHSPSLSRSDCGKRQLRTSVQRASATECWLSERGSWIKGLTRETEALSPIPEGPLCPLAIPGHQPGQLSGLPQWQNPYQKP